jgi:hypothetical protein
MEKNNVNAISAEEFERRFDEGEDITPYLDLKSARRINQEAKRVNVDFPVWMVEAMDREADRIGITRQAFIKVVVAERLGDVGRS